jgi:hypothetical protein
MPRKLKDETKIPAEAARSFFGEVETYLIFPDEPPSNAARQYVAGILRELALAEKDHQRVFMEVANINYRRPRASNSDVLHKVWSLVARGDANITEATGIVAEELGIDERDARHALSKSLESRSESGQRLKYRILKPNQLRGISSKPAKKRVPKSK